MRPTKETSNMESEASQFEAVFDENLRDFEREVQIILLLKFIAQECDLTKFQDFCKEERLEDEEEESVEFFEDLKDDWMLPDERDE